MKKVLAAPVIAHLLLLQAAVAQEKQAQDADEPPMQTVQVVSTRDPALMPYSDIVMFRRVFASDHVPKSIAPGLRVSRKKDGMTVQNLLIRFSSNGTATPLPLRSGFARLDELPVTDDPQAEFLSNQRKGSLQIEVLLTVELQDPQHFSYGQLMQAIDDANKVRSTVLPWYLRLLVPKFQEVAACFAGEGGAAIVGAGESLRVVTANGAADCLVLKPNAAQAESAVTLSRPPLYVRLL
jgi:hypothetical protein